MLVGDKLHGIRCLLRMACPLVLLSFRELMLSRLSASKEQKQYRKVARSVFDYVRLNRLSLSLSARPSLLIVLAVQQVNK